MCISVKFRPFIIVIFALFAFIQIHAQVLSPKYEFRGVWVATVNNIDWPSKPGLPVETMKAEAIQILDMHMGQGMNAIIFQVRPSADAFYNSELEPWSRYLTGIPGKAPDSSFDPLQFWIQESHKRGMELHAWMNPFRLALNASQPLAGNHIAFRNPDWVIKYDNKLFFDPGIPAAREHFVKVVTDVVKRYVIDAIHFDDYFYPYPSREPFPDHHSFSRFNRAFSPELKDHWRRENVDIMIKTLSDTIKAIKPWVKFGISPFGVWRNRASDPEGSDTRAGVTNYDDLYADIRKWLREGWIDYVIPQIYWEMGHTAADFETLVRWWNRNVFGKGLFIGQAPYKVGGGTTVAAWNQPRQLPGQIDLLRKFDKVNGSAYFSSIHFKRDLLGFQDSLKNRIYRSPALIPPMPWLPVNPPPAPIKVKVSGRKVHWQSGNAAPSVNDRERYLIYLNEAGQPFDPLNPAFIVQYTHLKAVQFNRKSGKKKEYEVRISALDRVNNESSLTEPIIIKL